MKADFSGPSKKPGSGMRRIYIAAAAALILFLAVSTSMADSRQLLSIDAIPNSILADGKSFSQIVVTVMGAGGQPASDGTEVRFAASAGTITPAAYTSNSTAAAILYSSCSSEIALVTASVEDTSASVQVEFTSMAEDASLGSKIIRMEGGSLAYSVERSTILASDSVAIEYRGLVFRAASIQVCEPMGTMKGQGDVSITRGEDEIQADAFVYDLRTDRFRTLYADETLKTSTFRADQLRPLSMTGFADTTSAEFAPLDAEVGTQTWIVSRKLVLFPDDKIQFTKATIYMGDTRILSFPHYVYDLNNRGALLNQVRYSSYEGLVVDLPMYYRVTDSDSGALKLRYAGKGSGYGGYFRPQEGLSLAIDQTYSLGNDSEGRLFIDAIDNAERSFELTHHLEFGSIGNSGRADLSLRLQPVSDFANNVYTTYLNASGAVGKYNYSISGYMGGSEVPLWNPLNPEEIEYSKQSNGSIRASLRTRRPFFPGGNISAFPTLSIGYGRPAYNPGNNRGSCLYESIGLNFQSMARRRHSSGLSFNGSTELMYTADGRMGTSLRLGTNLRRSGPIGSASLGYMLDLHAGSVGSMNATSVHNLTAMVFLGSGGKWNCNSFFNYGLDTGRMNLFSSASYHISSKLNLRTDYSLYRYTYKINGQGMASTASYLKTGIYYPLGAYEIGLAWSPNGQNYGLNEDKRFWLEFGRSSF
jgi:hypothetical protein